MTTLFALAATSMVAASMAVGCAVAPEAPEEAAETNAHLEGSSLTNERPEIGAVEVGFNFCTGTLISPNVVVTAAHCIRYSTRSTPGLELGAFRIDLDDGPRRYSFDRQIAYSSSPGANDVALLRLSEPVPSSVATPTQIATSTPSTGSAFLFGYGCQDRGGMFTDHGPPLNQKQILEIGTGRVRSVCPGDSGGPTTVSRTGPVYRVTSAYVPTQIFGFGFADQFGDLVGRRDELLAQVAAWAP